MVQLDLLPNLYPEGLFLHFNSTMVQLDWRGINDLQSLPHDFNSTMVQLDSPTPETQADQKTTISIPLWFN